ncbi:MAG: SDR family oxidoreductase [Paracoccaceae bacterium]
MSQQKTVLLTGATGFIAKHIALKLLNAGYDVVGSVRSLSRGDEVRAAVQPHISKNVDLDKNLRFVALDLGEDTGWDEAMAGIDILMHTASPFPLAQPKDENDLIRPAVDGTLRALRAAHKAGIKRVVLTSSFAAVMKAKLPDGRDVFNEDDWSDPNDPTIDAYSKSKTMAEQAAWNFIRDQAPDMALTTINPTLVLGVPLDMHFGSSVEVVQRILRAKDPMLPNLGLGVVDVGDIAEMHVRALSSPATEGKRILGIAEFVWFADLAKILKARFPDRKIVTRVAPNFLIRLLAIFDSSIRSIVSNLGKRFDVSNDRAKQLLGMEFVPADQCLIATAEFLIDHDKVG